VETFELKYFVAVARRENIQRAALDLAVSPGSLSKAVARLELELGVNLFERVGRNIRLTKEGHLLLARAAEILHLEEATKTDLQGSKSGLQIRIAAPEILLAKVATDLVLQIQKEYPLARFAFTAATEAETERMVRAREAHLGITTSTVGAGLTKKRLFEAHFQTVVGKGHPLYKAGKAGRSIEVAQVLSYPFVAPTKPILGLVGKGQSPDGWRDDKFPRRIGFVANSLQLLQELVMKGIAVAYLPDYCAESFEVAALNIPDCPYLCRQIVHLVALDPESASWSRRLF